MCAVSYSVDAGAGAGAGAGESFKRQWSGGRKWRKG